MRSANWPSQAENELADEAIRLLPAIAAARIREEPDQLRILYENYIERAVELGVCTTAAWRVMSVSSVLWITQLVHVVAEQECTTTDNAATILIARALEWTNV